VLHPIAPKAGALGAPVRRSKSCSANHNATAAGNRRHNGNGITVFQHGGFFFQVAHVFVVDVDVDERAQFAVLGIEMALQIGMLRNQARKGLAHGLSRDMDRGLFPRVLAKWRRNLDLGHTKKMLWYSRKMQVEMERRPPSAVPRGTDKEQTRWTLKKTNAREALFRLEYFSCSAQPWPPMPPSLCSNLGPCSIGCGC